MKRSPTKKRWRNTGPTAEVVDLVLARDQQCCVVCGGPVNGVRGWDWSLQHRVRRGAGSTRREWINKPANLILVDGSGTTGCHGRVESARIWAEASGYIVRDGITLPHQAALKHAVFGLWVWLDNDGGYRVVAE